MGDKNPITGKGSVVKPTDGPAAAYNLQKIDTGGQEALESAANISTSPAPQAPVNNQQEPTTDNAIVPEANTIASDPTSAPVSSNDVSGQTTPVGSQLYNLTREEALNAKYNIGAKYTEAIASFDKGDIVDKMRLKTGGVADLDSAIENLKVDMNKSRPELMKRYASVIDPKKREALISAEESNIAKQINDLSAVRKYRLGAIKDMTNAEIASQENKLKGLEAQFNLYQNVIGDLDKAEKTKSDMEKLGLSIQKSQIELMGLENKYGLEFKEGGTSYGGTDVNQLASKYPNEASFKYNNTSGIKMPGSSKTHAMLRENGIDLTAGGKVPKGEAGSYVVFDSLEDSFATQKLLLSKTGWNSVYDRLKSWVGTAEGDSYASGILDRAGLDRNIKFDQLNDDQWMDLIMEQTKKESPGLYKEIAAGNIKIDPRKVLSKGGYEKTGLSQEEKDAEEDKKNLKFDDYIKEERNDIVTGLKGENIGDVKTALGRLYPGEKDPYITIGRTLGESERDDIMQNIITQSEITDDKSSLSKLNELISEYSSLFYPDEKAADIEYQLGQDFLDRMEVGDTEGFLNMRQNLREKFNDQFED